MSNFYYINTKKANKNNAGAKAPEDVAELCRRRGYTEIGFRQFPSSAKSTLYKHLWIQLIGNMQWMKLKNRVSKDDIILFQHPSYGKRTAEKWISLIRRKKQCYFIALIHDLEALRGGVEGLYSADKKKSELLDNKLLSTFDLIICHNQKMKQYLLTQGFVPEEIICLELFDYLSECEGINPIDSDVLSIAIAGNLTPGKSGYIYKMVNEKHNKNLQINLYGNGIDPEKISDNMIYHGSFKPEELPKYLKGRFGLVWDGIEAKTCSGNTGDYLRYNNPHKASLYLSSGMPIVVWRESAIAEFVVSHGVGIAVDDLYQLEERLHSITEEDYLELLKNVMELSKLLHEGFHFYAAIDKCKNILLNKSTFKEIL